MPSAIYTLTNPRFPEGCPCEILRQIPGTQCWLVDAHAYGGTSTYATESELTGYGPDDDDSDWRGNGD